MPDADDEMIPMTYRDLADHLGITIENARVMAQRRVSAGRWRKTLRNDGQVVLSLPRSDLTRGQHRRRRAVQTAPLRGNVAPTPEGRADTVEPPTRAPDAGAEPQVADPAALALARIEGEVTELRARLDEKDAAHRAELARMDSMIRIFQDQIAAKDAMMTELQRELLRIRRPLLERLADLFKPSEGR